MKHVLAMVNNYKRVLLPAMLLCLVFIFVPAAKIKAASGLWTDDGNYNRDWLLNGQDCYGNDGSEKAPYTICTEQDLAAFSYFANLPKDKGGDFSGKFIYFKGQDLDMSAFEWVPIGLYNEFRGTILGNNAVIRNVILGGCENNQDYSLSGFFARFGGTAKDLTLEKIRYSFEGMELTAIGGFAAFDEGTVTNCKVEGDITCKKVRVALIGGFAADAGNAVSTESSSSIVNICLISNDEEMKYLGGFAGVCNNNVVDCRYSGNIVLDDSRIGCAGGFVGYGCESAEINRCMATSTFKIINQTKIGYLGGFAGIAPAHTMNCNATFDINAGSANTVETAGGFIGMDKNGGGVENCSVRVNINMLDVDGKYIGGFIGMGEATELTECYSYGSVLTGRISYVGGFNGFLANGNVSRCKAEMKVTCTDLLTQSGAIVGGFSAYASRESFDTCYARGSISAGIYSNTGGFCGMGQSSAMNSCYAIGTLVTGIESGAGGFIGTCIDMNIAACYANYQISGGKGVLIGGAIASAEGENKIESLFWCKDKPQSVNGATCPAQDNKDVGNGKYLVNVIGISDSMMKSPIFCGFLNSCGGYASWQQNSTQNQGYPYLV